MAIDFAQGTTGAWGAPGAKQFNAAMRSSGFIPGQKTGLSGYNYYMGANQAPASTRSVGQMNSGGNRRSFSPAGGGGAGGGGTTNMWGVMNGLMQNYQNAQAQANADIKAQQAKAEGAVRSGIGYVKGLPSGLINRLKGLLDSSQEGPDYTNIEILNERKQADRNDLQKQAAVEGAAAQGAVRARAGRGNVRGRVLDEALGGTDQQTIAGFLDALSGLGGHYSGLEMNQRNIADSRNDNNISQYLNTLAGIYGQQMGNVSSLSSSLGNIANSYNATAAPPMGLGEMMQFAAMSGDTGGASGASGVGDILSGLTAGKMRPGADYNNPALQQLLGNGALV